MDLHDIQLLTELKYQNSQRKMAAIQRREHELRKELNRLKSLARYTHAQPPTQEQMRAIGADVIWLRWVGQAQERLNIELAQVLAQKEALIAQHKTAFGKMMVSQELVEEKMKDLARHRRGRSLDAAINYFLPK